MEARGEEMERALLQIRRPFGETARVEESASWVSPKMQQASELEGPIATLHCIGKRHVGESLEQELVCHIVM